MCDIDLKMQLLNGLCPLSLLTIWEYQQADWLTEWVWMETETHRSEIETFKLTLNIPILVSISFRFVSLFFVRCFSSFFSFFATIHALSLSNIVPFLCLHWFHRFSIQLLDLSLKMNFSHFFAHSSDSHADSRIYLSVWARPKNLQNRFAKQCKYQIKKFQYTQSFSSRFADFISLASFAHPIYILIWFLCIKGIENATDSEKWIKTHFPLFCLLNSIFFSRHGWNCIFLPKHMFGALEGIKRQLLVILAIFDIVATYETDFRLNLLRNWKTGSPNMLFVWV